MKNLTVLIKPASSLCNMRCKYCFYSDISDLREVKSFGIMKEKTMIEMIDNIYRDLDEEDTINFGFQGGEPTIAGLDFFENFTKYIGTKNRNINVNYTIQTNGILIDGKWCKFFKDHNFLVGLSLDLLEENHNKSRVDVKGDGTYDKVLKTKRLFDKYGIEYNVLCVLTDAISKKPKEIFQSLLKNNIQYVQFIPCLDDLETKENNKYALKPYRFSSFYKELYPLWKNEYLNGNYISIKFFDDVANLLGRGIVGACGLTGNCTIQYVIEADGSVYPCDFYVLDKYKMGNITDSTLRELFNKDISYDFLYKEKPELSKKCQVCEFLNICGGGCKRMKDSMYLSPDEKYCGYKDFLKTYGKDLMMFAKN